MQWKLEKTFGELLANDNEGIVDGEVFTLTDKAIPTVVELKLKIDHEESMTDHEHALCSQ